MILREFSRRLQRMWGTLILLSVIIYFSYHFISGQRGFIAWRNLEIQLQQRQQHLEGLNNEIQKLEHSVQLLKSDSVSLDYLEERAKSSLGFAKPNEILVIFKDKAQQEKSRPRRRKGNIKEDA